MSQRPRSGKPAILPDLPPEILDHVVHSLPTASSVASLGLTSKSLHAYVEEEGWRTFARTKFPSTCPPGIPRSWGTVRSLSTLSRAWDRRAIVAQNVQVTAPIRTFPGNKIIDSWRVPRGQTIGFAPQLDALESIGGTWRDRTETLAFSAGAEICIRTTTRNQTGANESWTTYRPHSAIEGKDDVTALHLLRPHIVPQDPRLKIISGTARGDLQLLTFPNLDSSEAEIETTHFATQGLPVRSASALQDPYSPPLLAANLGDARIALYPLAAPQQSPTAALSEIDIPPPLRADGHPSSTHRVWSTSLLSASAIAVGTGPSDHPIHVYAITPSGLTRAPLRKYSLQSALMGTSHRPVSSVYTIIPLPPVAAVDSGSSGSGGGPLFLSGAYDGLVRLHDQRSPRAAEQEYTDATNDSAVYSLLPRGREQLVAGTGQHSLLKVFDLRMGAKRYSYLDASAPPAAQQHSAQNGPGGDDNNDDDGARNRAAEESGSGGGEGGRRRSRRISPGFNIFLRQQDAPTGRRRPAWGDAAPRRPGRGGGGGGSGAESSVYSLAAPSAHSPHVYAGVENTVVALAFTELLDRHPDPVFFTPWTARSGERVGSFRPRDVLSLAMHEQGADMRLCMQRSVGDTLREYHHQCRSSPGGGGAEGLGLWDDRWREAERKI